ncbi:MAG: NosD domain-containing protein [Thermoplasmata archaeon]
MSEEGKVRLMVIPIVAMLAVTMIVAGWQQSEENDVSLDQQINAQKGTFLSEDDEDTLNYTTREPIRIDGNEDFAEKAEENNWPGNGSEDDPYVIEGYEIDGGGYGYGIFIGNVTNHFVVRECYVYNVSADHLEDLGQWPVYLSPSGIHLYNSENGRVEENRLYGTQSKIRLSNSEDNTIINNSIMNGSIRLSGGSHNMISHNLIQNHNKSAGTWNGIALFGRTELNSVKHNTIMDKNYGIHISYDVGHNESAPEDNNIGNNTFTNVEEEIFKSIGTEDGGSNNNDEENDSWFQTRSFYYIAILLGISAVIFALGWRRVKKEGKK